jgi:trigger factor
MDKERADVLAGLRRDLRIPGFRKGKVPVGIIQKHYADVIQSDAVRNLLPAVFEQALEREHLFPLGDPRFENVRFEEGGVAFDVRIDVRPEIKLKGYTGITVELKRQPVEDADVNQAVETLRERLAVFEKVDRPALASDYLVIDYVPLTAAGEPEEKSRVKGYPVSLASDGLLAEFRTELLGAKAGDEKEIRVVYPSDFGDEALAGTSRTFRVKVNEVKEKMLPEIDDNFARRIDETAAGLLELRLRIRQQLEAEEEARHRQAVDEKIMDAILAANPFEVPEAMVENYLASLVAEDKRQRGPVADEEARATEVRRAFRASAERMIRRYFVLDAVKRQENLAVSEAEVDERLRAVAERLGKPEAEVRSHMAGARQRRGLESDLLDEKTMGFLRERATVRS